MNTDPRTAVDELVAAIDAITAAWEAATFWVFTPKEVA